MDILSPIGIIVIALVAIVLGNFISKILKVVFYLLLITFVIVILFGVSYTDVLSWATEILVWVF